MSMELETRSEEPEAAVAESAVPAEAPAEAEVPAIDERQQLDDRIRSSARWFHWVAGLSVVNSVILLAGGSWSFLFGLGATQFVDGIVLAAIDEDPGTALLARYLGLGINLMIAAGYVLFGWMAGRRKTWAFAVGTVLYALDGMIFLLFQDFLGLAFHGWVLFSLVLGLRASYRYGLLRRG